MARAKSKKFNNLPQELMGLEDLAFNLWWSWHPAGRMLFKELNREAWKVGYHNPIKMLEELPGDVLRSASIDSEYLRNYHSVMVSFQGDLASSTGWFAENVKDPGSLPIAYFSAEYGPHHTLPFYAGGLGFLAGITLRSATIWPFRWLQLGSCIPRATCAREFAPTDDRRMWMISEGFAVCLNCHLLFICVHAS